MILWVVVLSLFSLPFLSFFIFLLNFFMYNLVIRKKRSTLMVIPLGWCSWSRPWDRWCRREAGVLSNDEEWGQEHGQNRGPCRTGDIGGDSMLKLSHQQDECMSWDFRMESKFFWVLKSLLFISQESALISLRAFSCGLYLFSYTIWKRIIWSCWWLFLPATGTAGKS